MLFVHNKKLFFKDTSVESYLSLTILKIPYLLDLFKLTTYTKCNKGAITIMNEIVKKIQSSGGRLTQIKKGIIGVLSEKHCLLSKKDLIAKLKAKKIQPDRSTLYRELQFLSSNGVIIKNTISGIDYYEIPTEHHHHLVCLKCHRIDKVAIGNQLEKQEKQIAKQNNFYIINHSLEFYGHCPACRQVATNTKHNL